MRRLLVLTLMLILAACQRDAATGGSGATGSGRATTDARIVTLTPSATEIVDALGQAASLVGVDSYSTYPPSVKTLPKVGSFMTPDLETIVRLRPTLVIVDDIHGQAAGALNDAGIATIECPMHDLADVKSGLRAVGARLGRVTEAETEVAKIDAELDAAAARRPAHHPRVLAVLDREAGGVGNLTAAGPGSWLDELVAVTGGDNALAAAPTRYPKVTTEEVLRTQPEVVLDLSMDKDITPWRALDIPAARTKRIFSIADDTLAHPTPRVGHALQILSSLIAPAGANGAN